MTEVIFYLDHPVAGASGAVDASDDEDVPELLLALMAL